MQNFNIFAGKGLHYRESIESVGADFYLGEGMLNQHEERLASQLIILNWQNC
jgi:hypothetical protein